MYVWQPVLLHTSVNASQRHFIIIRLTVLE